MGEVQMAERFTGFPPESLEFFRELAAHNNRDWFLAHKDVYQRACRGPMEALVAELEPRVGKVKISRINRDIRFSRDKAPYKTYIAAGVGGNYISLSADGLFVGGGFYAPDAGALQRFRAAVDDDTTGRRLQAIVRTLRRRGYEVGSHETLSSAPRGYSSDHPRIELLKMKDLFAGRRFAPAAWLATAKARGRIDRVITDTAPLVKWLRQHVTA
ncbi:MAG TPA: DUF2461 domain-containing protein [Vicinamibacteria bacterium]|nr:DUF2461 domain-containing protein [Vicinamibacteria bacterium]